MRWEINNSNVYDSILMKIIWYDQKQPLNNSRGFEVRQFLNYFHFSVNLLWVMVCNYTFFKTKLHTADPDDGFLIYISQQSLKFIWILLYCPSFSKLLCLIGFKYADKSRVVVMVQVPRLRYGCKTLLLPNINRERKKKRENPLKPSGNCSPARRIPLRSLCTAVNI